VYLRFVRTRRDGNEVLIDHYFLEKKNFSFCVKNNFPTCFVYNFAAIVLKTF